MDFATKAINGLGLRSKPINAVSFPPQHFAKKAFNLKANLNTPEQRDLANVGILGDPVRGKELYVLG